MRTMTPIACDAAFPQDHPVRINDFRSYLPKATILTAGPNERPCSDNVVATICPRLQRPAICVIFRGETLAGLTSFSRKTERASLVDGGPA